MNGIGELNMSNLEAFIVCFCLIIAFMSGLIYGTLEEIKDELKQIKRLEQRRVNEG